MPDETERDRPRHLRILFFVHNVGKARHFEGVIERLTLRGHTVILAAAAKRSGFKAGRKAKRLETVACPTRRVDRWKTAAPTG